MAGEIQHSANCGKRQKYFENKQTQTSDGAGGGKSDRAAKLNQTLSGANRKANREFAAPFRSSIE